MLHNCKRKSKIIEVDSVNAGVTAERMRSMIARKGKWKAQVLRSLCLAESNAIQHGSDTELRAIGE